MIILAAGIFLVFLFFPGIVSRSTQGFWETDVAGQATVDEELATAGRLNTFWPLAINQIGKAPIFGEGCLTFRRTVSDSEVKGLDPSTRHPRHPHNMHLQMLLDCGLVGLAAVLPFYVGIYWISMRLFRSRGDELVTVVGGSCLAAVSALLICGLGGQTMYPHESTLGMFVLYGLVMRAWVMVRQGKMEALRSTTPQKSGLSLSGIAAENV